MNKERERDPLTCKLIPCVRLHYGMLEVELNKQLVNQFVGAAALESGKHLPLPTFNVHLHHDVIFLHRTVITLHLIGALSKATETLTIARKQAHDSYNSCTPARLYDMLKVEDRRYPRPLLQEARYVDLIGGVLVASDVLVVEVDVVLQIRRQIVRHLEDACRGVSVARQEYSTRMYRRR